MNNYSFYQLTNRLSLLFAAKACFIFFLTKARQSGYNIVRTKKGGAQP